MASGGDDSSGNNRANEPEEEELAVLRDTEGVFRHFMFQRYQDETERGEQSGEMSSSSARPDALEELRSCSDLHQFSQNLPVIGKRLGEIGDEIDAKYKDQFKDMIDSLSLTPATAYETFAALARRLFRSGINWGRIVALLCFGYEIAVTVIRRGFSGNFLRRIIRFVVDFIFNERIARWIAEHGGWRGVLDFRLSEPSWYTIGIVLLLGGIAAFFATKKR
ncbi:Bcl-2 homologous antagonist/killer [Acropora cervicornis]|uniref:Bcl-2 homologous antagonist/killer n=1 Tax=Acropora cervicornis TaxID=6130 RepID=A0AAD9R463_ACRCE|nr:Bcl-2 homologous antagonist/killer [Acropora cervicornis]